MEVEHPKCGTSGTPSRDGGTRRTPAKAGQCWGDRAHPGGAGDHSWCGPRPGYLCSPIDLEPWNPVTLLSRRRGQVVRRQTAKLLSVSSILTGVSRSQYSRSDSALTV